MRKSQPGIFALGTASQSYLEFDLAPGRSGRDLVDAISAFHEARSTMGGVNLVVGFRPELWSAVTPNDAPAGVKGFNDDVVGIEGFRMPATQHDAVLWLAGSAYDGIFDLSRQAIAALKGLASVADETSSWPYHQDHDLTGFIDGSENPRLIEAPGVALIPEGKPGEAGSVLLFQKWVHDSDLWESLSDASQAQVIGRTKADSIELEDKPADSHVACTDQDRFGKIFRRNMPYGTVTNHGTMFVGFCAEQGHLSAMLDSMAGRTTGVRDALTRFTKPISGAYYFVPSIESMQSATSVTAN